jgi:hypothetical protein
LATALNELLESRDNRRARIATPRVRKIGSTGSVARAQAANAVGTEPARVIPRGRKKLLELDPCRRSIRNELV